MLSKEKFLAAFGTVFEHSPWIAEQAYDAGIASEHDDIDMLHAVLARIVHNAPYQAQQDLIENHPALAAPLPEGDMHDSSRNEQAGAGLASLSSSQREEFDRLNAAYQKKFGFVFILAVEGLQADVILDNFKRRMADGTAAGERAEALTQIIKIARLRMGRL